MKKFVFFVFVMSSLCSQVLFAAHELLVLLQVRQVLGFNGGANQSSQNRVNVPASGKEEASCIAGDQRRQRRERRERREKFKPYGKGPYSHSYHRWKPSQAQKRRKPVVECTDFANSESLQTEEVNDENLGELTVALRKDFNQLSRVLRKIDPQQVSKRNKRFLVSEKERLSADLAELKRNVRGSQGENQGGLLTSSLIKTYQARLDAIRDEVADFKTSLRRSNPDNQGRIRGSSSSSSRGRNTTYRLSTGAPEVDSSGFNLSRGKSQRNRSVTFRCKKIS